MEDEEREAAVQAHIKALDDEIARLRKLESAMDERIDAAEEERRRMADATRQAAADEPDAG